MIKNLQKIFIVGSPGAGKTTLAKKLSLQLSIPHYDLDDIRYPSQRPKATDKQAIPIVHRLTQTNPWIIEGVYISWIQECLDKTDVIIWLDIPYYIALYRIMTRYLKNLTSGNNRHGFKSTVILIKNVLRYHFPKPGTELNDADEYITRYKTSAVLSQYQHKVIWIKSPHDLKRLDWSAL